MRLDPMPAQAAFRHVGSRDGFEVVFIESVDGQHVLRGVTTTVEDGIGWSVSYEVVLDSTWHTREVTAVGRSAAGERSLFVARTSKGSWVVNETPRPDLDGCADVDLESSLVTNTLPIHRLLPTDGTTYDTAAVFVRARSLAVERLEQTYRYLGTKDTGHSFGYESPTFSFSCLLSYDGAGLITDYPGLGYRHGQ